MTNDIYANRRFVIAALMLSVVLIYIARLINLQLVDQTYQDKADSNAYLRKVQFPARGIIRDRNDKVLVFNKLSYDVMVVPREMIGFDTLEFCRSVNITKKDFIEKVREMRNRVGYSRYTPQLLIAQLDAHDYGVLHEKGFLYPGMYLQKRTLREYNYPNAALLLGSIGEVGRNTLKADTIDHFYVPGDYAGQNGGRGDFPA